jgi:hypothetical protein
LALDAARSDRRLPRASMNLTLPTLADRRVDRMNEAVEAAIGNGSPASTPRVRIADKQLGLTGFPARNLL